MHERSECACENSYRVWRDQPRGHPKGEGDPHSLTDFDVFVAAAVRECISLGSALSSVM